MLAYGARHIPLPLLADILALDLFSFGFLLSVSMVLSSGDVVAFVPPVQFSVSICWNTRNKSGGEKTALATPTSSKASDCIVKVARMFCQSIPVTIGSLKPSARSSLVYWDAFAHFTVFSLLLTRFYIFFYHFSLPFVWPINEYLQSVAAEQQHLSSVLCALGELVVLSNNWQ